MDRQEQVQNLAKVARISVAYAEDLYDSFFPKPVIPWYIADYLEKVKSEGDLTVVGAVNEAPEGRVGDWLILEKVNIFAKAWVNGYKVEGEPRYTVRIKGIKVDKGYLNYDRFSNTWSFEDDDTSLDRFRATHTRKELEECGFCEVFDNPMFEVKEVTDEKPNFADPEWSLKDAIGDSIVTLIVLCLQLGYDVEECLTIAYNDIKDRQGVMIDGNFVKTKKRESANNSNDSAASSTGN